MLLNEHRNSYKNTRLFVTMGNKIKYKNEKVTKSCELMQDDQRFHNSKYMANATLIIRKKPMHYQKSAIVPGLLVLADAAAQAPDSIGEDTHTIEAYFPAFTSVGEEIELEYEKRDDPARVLASAKKEVIISEKVLDAEGKPVKDSNGNQLYNNVPHIVDILGNEKGRTCFSTANHEHYEHKNPVERTSSIPSYTIKEFGDLIGCKNPNLTTLLFAISHTSPHLLKTIREPLNEQEQEIYDLVNNTALPSIPFYDKVKINITNEVPETKDINNFKYTVSSFKVDRKTAEYSVNCSLEDRLEIGRAHV